MKKHKILFLIITINLLLSSCGSVQKAFDPQRKNNSDEFLVEKKSPLSTPPDFEKLPKPKDKQNPTKNFLLKVLLLRLQWPYQLYQINSPVLRFLVMINP